MKYSIVQQPNQKGTKFTVDEETGEVSTNKVFDREGDDGKFVSVTVKATDQGEPSLEGVCSFTVEITDVNDNPPLFDRQVNHKNLIYNFLLELIMFLMPPNILFRNMLRMSNKMPVSVRTFYESLHRMRMPTITVQSFTACQHRIILKILTILKFNPNLDGLF